MHTIAVALARSPGLPDSAGIARLREIHSWMDQFHQAVVRRLADVEALAPELVFVVHEWGGSWRPNEPKQHAVVLVAEIAGSKNILSWAPAAGPNRLSSLTTPPLGTRQASSASTSGPTPTSATPPGPTQPSSSRSSVSSCASAAAPGSRASPGPAATGSAPRASTQTLQACCTRRASCPAGSSWRWGGLASPMARS